MANRTPTTNALEARRHQHNDQWHLHRRGNEPHEHDSDGRPVFPEDDHPRDPATGKFVAKQEPTLAEDDTLVLGNPTVITTDGLLWDIDQRLELIDDLADRAAENITLEPGLVDLAVQSFEHEAKAFEAAAVGLQAEVVERSRYMFLAAVAQAQGHHPLSAYCFVADRLDPAGAAS